MINKNHKAPIIINIINARTIEDCRPNILNGQKSKVRH